MQIPILNGIYTDGNADFRTSYPINQIPIPKDNGISKGYLRPAHGIVSFGTGPGIDRGGINWNGVCYRVMGTKLVSINSSGTVTTLGDVGGSTQVSFDYSFDNLAIASNSNLFYWNGTTLTQVTDADLGAVLDVIFVDGYFMTTDGSSLVVTELNNPLAVNPLKYGSSEVDPDPVKAILKIRNEPHAVNRYTIEAFDNIGGDLFPFRRIEGALIQKGAIGTHACCKCSDALAFVGGGRNESPSVYIGSNGTVVKISTTEIDKLINEYSETELSTLVMESKVEESHEYLLIHLDDKTLVYDVTGSQAVSEPLWFILTSAINGFSKYRARNLVWCYDKWLCGDPTSTSIGYLTSSISSHFGSDVRWEFGTQIGYNEGRGIVIHELELIALTGRVALGEDPQISTSYSVDGETWSQDKFVKVGMIGDRAKRITWLQQGMLRNWRIQRFRGDSQAHISIARLEARIEPLAY